MQKYDYNEIDFIYKKIIHNLFEHKYMIKTILILHILHIH